MEVLKVSPHKCLTIYKGKNKNCVVEKAGGHHHNQVNKPVNMTSNGENRYHVSPYVTLKKIQHHFSGISTKKKKRQSNNETHQTNTKRMTFYKTVVLYSSKMARSRKIKKVKELQIKGD